MINARPSALWMLVLSLVLVYASYTFAITGARESVPRKNANASPFIRTEGTGRRLLPSSQRNEEKSESEYYYDDDDNSTQSENYYDKDISIEDMILVKPLNFFNQSDGSANEAIDGNKNKMATQVPLDSGDTQVPSMSPVGESSAAPSSQVTTDNKQTGTDDTSSSAPTSSPTKKWTWSPSVSVTTADTDVEATPMPSIPVTPSPTRSPTLAPTSEAWSDKIKDEREKLKQLANDRTAEVVASIIAFLGISGMLFTAYQFLENPDGLCASCCRLSLKVVSFLLKLLCLPCRICFGRYSGYTGSDPRNRTVFVEEYTNDLELT